MIGSIWNIRGTGKTGRKQTLADLIHDHKLEFIGIQETKCVSFSPRFLKYISGPWDFSWLELPANKSAGGILVGLREDLFEVITHCCFKFCLSVVLLDKRLNDVWQMVIVYGTPYYEYKMEFIAELHDIMDKSVVPIMFGGDFNLVRNSSDKSNGQINANWSFLFNDWINRWSLIDLNLTNRRFT